MKGKKAPALQQKASIISYSYSGKTTGLPKDPVCHRCGLVRNLSLATVSCGISGPAETGATGSKAGLSPSVPSSVPHTACVLCDFCGLSQLVWDHCTSVGILAFHKRSVRKNNSSILFPLWRRSGRSSRDIAVICPRADVREALGVIGSGGEKLGPRLRAWIEKAVLFHEQVG